MTSNLTRVDLYEAVYREVGLSRSESLAMVELVLKEITDSLEKGETVKLSSFGSFIVRKKKHRIGRNPKTGIECQFRRVRHAARVWRCPLLGLDRKWCFGTGRTFDDPEWTFLRNRSACVKTENQAN